MTLGEAAQLYTPLVGLMALAFWTGVLSQRVKQLEKRDDALAKLGTTVTRMDANMGHLTKSVDDLKDKLAWATEVPPHQKGRSPKGGQQ